MLVLPTPSVAGVVVGSVPGVVVESWWARYWGHAGAGGGGGLGGQQWGALSLVQPVMLKVRASAMARSVRLRFIPYPPAKQ